MSTHHHPTQAESQPFMRDSDAAWLQRGQRLGEAFLASREYPVYAGALTLTIFGASLTLLALFGAPEAGSQAHAGPTIAELMQ